MPLFQPTSFSSSDRAYFISQDGCRVSVGPGRVHALLTLGCEGPDCSDTGLISLFKVILNVADREMAVYRYLTRLKYTAALPPPGVECSHVYERSFYSAANVRPQVDPRGWMKLPLVSGGFFEPMPDHDRFTIELREADVGVLARIKTFPSGSRKLLSMSKSMVEYTIPIERFVWRRAPKIVGDEVIPEGDEAVHFVKLGVLESGMMGGVPLLPSPIVVECS